MRWFPLGVAIQANETFAETAHEKAHLQMCANAI